MFDDCLIIIIIVLSETMTILPMLDTNIALCEIPKHRMSLLPLPSHYSIDKFFIYFFGGRNKNKNLN